MFPHERIRTSNPNEMTYNILKLMGVVITRPPFFGEKRTLPPPVTLSNNETDCIGKQGQLC